LVIPALIASRRSSLYWPFYGHFDDRNALLDEILDAWERVGVDDVIQRVEGDGGDAKAKLRRLSRLAVPRGGEPLRIDLVVRAWARRDQKVATRVKRVDERRMEYLRSLFRAFSGDDEDVEARCLLFYCLWIGGHFILADHGHQRRADVVELALRRLECS
jgi:hypothetical protein